MSHIYAALLVVVASLSGCTQTSLYQPSDTSAGNSASGVTVFGEIDTSVVRTR